MVEPRFAIGLDLGTTNCVLAAVDLQDKARFPEIHDIPIVQKLDENLKGESKRLPSFLFALTQRQMETMELDACDPENWLVGEAAVELGRRIPGRLVTSAKSWLCHQRLDPSKAFLPWNSSDEMQKISPLQATIWILEHLKRAWQKAHFSLGTKMEDQILTVTLPASFDQAARQWTLQACKQAGLSHAKLLEEPQAAFYAWITLRKGRWGEALQGGRKILVCDVGGGTSDFSLMQGIEDGDNFKFERLAVGDHLLLGGDNVDLALAHYAESKLSEGKGKLNASQWQLLAQLARSAKESLLSDANLEQVTLRLPGSGRKVIGGLRQVTLTRAELNKLVLEGFYPEVDDNYQPRSNAGLSEMGLPYEAEPAITWHVLNFIKKHGAALAYPDWVLFNGGSLEPQMIRERILKVLNAHAPNLEHRVGVLESDSLANAVARGAAYYSFISLKGGLRIGGGSSKTYYLELGGIDRNRVCLIPKGAEPHEKHELNLEGLEVRTNHPVSFMLYESDQFPLDEVGQLRALEDQQSSGQLNTLVKFGKQGQRTIPVQVSGQLTELDTLQLELVSKHTEHHWDLEFDLRQSPRVEKSEHEPLKNDKFEWPFDVNAWVREQLSEQQPKSLIKQLELKLEVPKADWRLTLLRDLADALLNGHELAKKSPQHEAMWFAAISFAMRPGIGEMKDELRCNKLWSLFRLSPHFGRETRSNAEWAILWRRMAMGLEAGRQEDLYGRLKKNLFDKKGMPSFKGECAEIWRMVASFEHLSRRDKKKCGDALVKNLSMERSKINLELSFWALSRFGARLPLQAQVTSIPTFAEIEVWIEALLDHPQWKNEGAAQALLEMCRKCGEGSLDVSEAVKTRVEAYFEQGQISAISQWKNALNQVERRDLSMHQKLIGESLPSGLELKLD